MAGTAANGDLWVFGYGSLIWKPGFEAVERVRATAPGYRRSFCMTSIHYRGPPERPGLVLALDEAEGAEACAGLAYRVAAPAAAGVRDYLRERELVTYAYHEVEIALATEDGRDVTAVTFVVDRSHAQYQGALPHEAQAEIIAAAAGLAGPNAEYLRQTTAALRALAIEDPALDALERMVAEREGRR
ncbi:MAG: gamma-glutamylcyclotransferase [Pseudomonadota bacterium]